MVTKNIFVLLFAVNIMNITLYRTPRLPQLQRLHAFHIPNRAQNRITQTGNKNNDSSKCDYHVF